MLLLQELTEEGLPFLILFHRPGKDDETVKRYKDIANGELISEKREYFLLFSEFSMGKKKIVENSFIHPCCTATTYFFIECIRVVTLLLKKIQLYRERLILQHDAL